MSVNADDLPAAVRAKLGLPAKGRKRAAPSRAGTGLSVPSPGTCGCGEAFATAAAWEKHAQAAACTRYDLDLEALA